MPKKRNKRQPGRGGGKRRSPSTRPEARIGFDTEERARQMYVEQVEQLNEKLAALLGQRHSLRWWQRDRRATLDAKIRGTRDALADMHLELYRRSPEGLAQRRKFDEGMYDVRMRLAAQKPDPRSSDPASPDLRWHTWEQ